MKVQLTPNIMIKQCDTCPFLWDLVLTFRAIRADKMSDCEKILAYGLNFETVVKKIADFELNVTEEEVLNIKEYIGKYKEIQESSLSKLKEFLNNKK